MADSNFKVLIYGAGAVGLGIGSCLLRAGVSVDFIAREETVNALKSDGLVRSGIFGEHSAAAESFGAFASLDELIASEKIIKFLRSGGWVTLGIDPIRGKKRKFKGPERRVRLSSSS